MKTPTVYDVAESAGVSIATVSRVLRHPDRVREATRERVLTAVTALGYVPSGSARGLATRRTGAIGLYLPGFDAIEHLGDLPETNAGGTSIVSDVGNGAEDHTGDLYFDEVVRGAEVEAWRRGYALMVGVGRGDQSLRTFHEMTGRVDGLVILAQAVPDEVLARIAGRIPVVVLSAQDGVDGYDHVSVSNREGMAALAEYVWTRPGVTSVVYVTGPDTSPDSADRWAGFGEARERVAAAGQVRVIEGTFTRESGREAGAAVLAHPDRPDAIVCANDQMALGVLEVLHEAGVRVPEDVVVSGFDGIPGAAVAVPRLSTVRQPIEELGRAAISMLDERLGDPEAPARARRLPVTVLLRESTHRA